MLCHGATFRLCERLDYLANQELDPTNASQLKLRSFNTLAPFSVGGGSVIDRGGNNTVFKLGGSSGSKRSGSSHSGSNNSESNHSGSNSSDSNHGGSHPSRRGSNHGASSRRGSNRNTIREKAFAFPSSEVWEIKSDSE